MELLRQSTIQGGDQAETQALGFAQSQGPGLDHTRSDDQRDSEGQGQGHGPEQSQADDSTSFGSFQLSDADLMALLNSSPFDSSKAAIDPDEHEENETASSQSDPFITSLDQITPPLGLQAQQRPPPEIASVSPTTQPSSHARDQFSALRARLQPISRSPQPTTPSAALEKLLIDDCRDTKERLSRYISCIPDPFKDDHNHLAVMETGMDLFFSGFGRTVPVLGDLDDFESILGMLPAQSIAGRLVRRVVAALGYLVSSPAEMISTNDNKMLLQRLRSEAYALLSAAADGVSPQDAIRIDDLEALTTIQAALLLAYDSYGQDKLADAESFMRTGVDLALRMRLHLLDSSTLAQPRLADAHGESLRRTWWELYQADLLFTGTTSGRMARNIDTASLEVAVHTPIDPGFARLDRQSSLDGALKRGVLKTETVQGSSHDKSLDRQTLSQAYDIRIRTCALINECMKPSENPTEPDLDRIRALDTILSNMMILAQRHFVNARINSSAGIATSRKADGFDTDELQIKRSWWANDARVELLFTSLLMLYSSRIHLHRLAWFADLTMDFTTCSFKRPSETKINEQPRSPDSPDTNAAKERRRQSMLLTSVTRIVSSADAIMRLIRLDLRMSSSAAAEAQLNTTSKLPVHSPFFGCCNLVAAFGYVVAVAASGPEVSDLPTYGDEVRLYDDNEGFPSGDEGFNESLSYSFTTPSWQQGSPEANLSFLTAGNVDPSLSTTAVSTTKKKQDAMVWKIRAAISNIGFAESTLAQYASIWPICSVYQQEVALCRNAIDSTGPTGLQ